jgi:hypothetical protein
MVRSVSLYVNVKLALTSQHELQVAPSFFVTLELLTNSSFSGRGVMSANKTASMGEKLVGSNLYRVHLHRGLESNNDDRSCQPTIYI